MANRGKKMRRATLADIEQASQPTTEVECPGLGASFLVRSLSVDEQMEFGELAADENRQREFIVKALAAACLEPDVDEEHAQMMLERMSGGDVMVLSNAVLEVSGMSSGFQEGAQG